MQNLMTICPPLANNSKQYDSTKSPLAMLEQTCRSIGADTSSNSKSSSQSIDHTKKDNGTNSLNKLHLNDYKASKQSIASINHLASLGYNYEPGRRSGSNAEYSRASVSPASSLDKNNSAYLANLAANGSRPNSNNGNSRPNSNNSGNSSLNSSKGAKELSKLSYKPYEEANNNNLEKSQQRKHNSPELEHLKSIKNEQRKSSDSLLNGISPKNSLQKLNNNNNNNLNSAAALSYAQQIESKFFEYQYQQYLAVLSGYPFMQNNPSLMASAALNNPLLQQQQQQQQQHHQHQKNSNLSAHQNSLNATSTNSSMPQHTSTNSHPHQNLIPSSNSSCPPGCNSCINHNPLLSTFAAAAAANAQTPSSVASSNQLNSMNPAHLAALSAQYPQIPSHLFSLYGLAGYPPLTPPSSANNNTSSSTTTTSTNLNSHSSLNNLNSALQPNLNPLLNSASNHINSNKNAVHTCFHISNGQCCNKRFNNVEEYLAHSKSHTVNDNLHNSNNNSLNQAALESLYGSYDAMLANPIANLRRSAMHENLSNSRFHPYGKPSSNASTNNYNSNPASALSAAASMLPPSLLNSANSLTAFPGLGALANLNGSSNPAALAAAFNNMYSYSNGGRPLGPTVQGP